MQNPVRQKETSMNPLIKRSLSLTLTAILLLLGFNALAQDPMVGKAHDFINLMAKGDFHNAYLKLDSNLGFQLKNGEKLSQMWNGLTQKAGVFQEIRASKSEMVSAGGGVNYSVVTCVVKFEKGHVDFKLAMDMRGYVADLRYGNHEDPIPGAELPEWKDAGASGGGSQPAEPPVAEAAE
jgi:hypothetical protein